MQIIPLPTLVGSHRLVGGRCSEPLDNRNLRKCKRKPASGFTEDQLWRAQGGLGAPDGQQTLDLGCFLGEIVKIMVSSQHGVLGRAGWLEKGWMLNRFDPTGCLDE